MATELFFSATGSGTQCTQAAPCTLTAAVSHATPGSEISCADGSDSETVTISAKPLTIDCAGTVGSLNTITINGGAVVVLRNITFWNVSNPIILNNGAVILDNVHIHNAIGSAIGAPSTAPSSIIVKNSVIDAGAGVLLKPNSGSSVSARFDHVTIANNTSGGIKIDSTNGAVTVDVIDSDISNNSGNGLNAIGGAGGAAMFSISRSVLANNGVAGVQANGASAAAILDTTLLDSNTTGATSIIAGGHVLTYGNNHVVGSSGSGFNGTPTPQ
jgi:hypothetical protein